MIKEERGRASRGLTTNAGKTMLTTTPSGSTSAATAVFHVFRPPLVQLYAARRGEGMRPDSEPIVSTSDLGASGLFERATRPGRMARVRWSVHEMFWGQPRL